MFVKYAAFFYTPDNAGHGWTDYGEIVRIFIASAREQGIQVFHIGLEEDIAHPSLVANEIFYRILAPFHNEGLVYTREKAYLWFLENHVDNTIMFCDPDQIFLKAIPDLTTGICARLVYRMQDRAKFNGPRLVNKGFIQVLRGTVERMSKMTDRYKQWDGDSLAFADSLREVMSEGKLAVQLATEEHFISRPSLGAPEDAFMYHFKGLKAKQEMLDYARSKGI
jgi:hypothetical protein